MKILHSFVCSEWPVKYTRCIANKSQAFVNVRFTAEFYQWLSFSIEGITFDNFSFFFLGTSTSYSAENQSIVDKKGVFSSQRFTKSSFFPNCCLESLPSPDRLLTEIADLAYGLCRYSIVLKSLKPTLFLQTSKRILTRKQAQMLNRAFRQVKMRFKNSLIFLFNWKKPICVSFTATE